MSDAFSHLVVSLVDRLYSRTLARLYCVFLYQRGELVEVSRVLARRYEEADPPGSLGIPWALHWAEVDGCRYLDCASAQFEEAWREYVH